MGCDPDLGPLCDKISNNQDKLILNDLKHSKGIKIACLNINSLPKHIDELRILMQNSPIDILAINETKIDDSFLEDEISLAGYHIIRKDRNRHGGGVLLYVHQAIPCTERNDLLTGSLENICVEIARPCSKPFLVSTWYRPPNANRQVFDDFEIFLRKCDLENKELILLGDLNCDISKSPLDAHTRRLQFLLSLYQFDQLINEPTRVTQASATLIDLLITNKKQNIAKAGVIHLGLSDHNLIFAVRKHCAFSPRQNVTYVRNFKNFNATDFLNDLSQIPWENVTLHDDPNICYRVWQSYFLQVLDQHAPLRRIRVRSDSHPWVTSNIKKLMRAREFHKKRAVKNRSHMHWVTYKKIRNKVNAELYKAKRSFFCKKINDCAQAKDPKQSWKLINELLGKNNRANNVAQLKTDDIIITNDRKIAESFNDYFVNIGAKLANEIENNLLDSNSSENNFFRPDIQFKFSEINQHEVFLQLDKLKTSKSTGIDNIPARALKISAVIITPSLTWIFNSSIKTGIYVDEWKKAWVLPIFKSEDRQKCENYRPISILPIISKIFERSVFNQLYTFLNDNSLLSKYQSGFRPKNSTLSALIQMCDASHASMDCGDVNAVVFLDIRKAFDSINHDILLRKMEEQFGVSNVELKWFESYISNREQTCLVNGTMSTAKKLVCGVPQGSILGPLLFLLYINDLPDSLHDTIPCLYADDTQIFTSAKDPAELTSKLNSDLNNINHWLISNKLQHHSSKTKLMYVASKHNLNKINGDTPVMLNGQPIPRIHSIPCLGVTLDETLSWEEHIEAICKKVGAGIGMLKRIKPFVPAQMLQPIYSAMIQPYFDYCSPLWHTCNKTLKDKLQKYQNRAARIIAGASYEIRSADVLQTLKWENLESRRVITKATLMYKILNDHSAQNLKELLTRRNSLQTAYDLRNSQNDLALPKPRCEFLKKSFKYSGSKLWNNLSPEAKEAQSICSFKNLIRLTNNLTD